jgi:hypothetical protein
MVRFTVLVAEFYALFCLSEPRIFILRTGDRLQYHGVSDDLSEPCDVFIEKIQRLFGTSRFQSLLLEVFAIFLGISASFAVEEWREGRQEQEEFQRYLQAIYFDALRQQASLRREVYRNNQSVMALHLLLEDGVTELPDDELVALIRQVFRAWAFPQAGGSYRALLEAGVSAGFDDTMQALNNAFELDSNIRSQLANVINQHNRAVNEVRAGYASVSNPLMAVAREDGTVFSGARFDQPEYAGVRDLFFDGERFLPAENGLRQIREALHQPEVRRMLIQELELTMQATDGAIAMVNNARSVEAAVRERLPDLHVAVHKLELVGDALPGEWTVGRGELMSRDAARPNVWLAEVTLGEGSLKLVANDTWGTSWGAPITWEQIDPQVFFTQYTGDRSEVFPVGVAEFDGLNIPVEPGRYRVRFNTYTFEYSFERVGG